MNTDTRDRLNKLLAEDFKGKTVDQLIQHLIDEEWKRGCLEDWQRLHADPEAWRDYLREAEGIEQGLFEPVDEPPFESADREWLAAGGRSLTEKDAS